MAPGFDAGFGAEGWQVSTSPIMLMALHKASLDIFKEVGSIDILCCKGDNLTGYLEFLLNNINEKLGYTLFEIITPEDVSQRGSQLSVVCCKRAKDIFNYLTQHGVIGDWREPDVIRLSPVPLYNSFRDVFETAHILTACAAELGL
jgi:kynureninase